MRIDAERLYRLSVVIEERSFSRAALRLCVSQPTLTTCIAQLEGDLGVKLLHRGRHGAQPTVYGQQLYERAKVVEAELLRAQRDIVALADGKLGKVVIGVTSGAGLSMACPAICRLLDARPDLQLEIIEATSENELMTQLRHRELDLVICPSVSSPGLEDFRGEPLFRTRRVIVTRPGHPVARRRQVTARALAPYRLVVPKDTTELGAHYREIFAASSVEFPRRTVVAASLSAAKEIVMQSDCFTLCTEQSVTAEVRRGLLATHELGVPTSHWYWAYFNARARITPAMTAFVRELLNVCNEQNIEVKPLPSSLESEAEPTPLEENDDE